MHRQPRQLARRSRLQRAQGIEIEERVWRLYVAGKRQVAIAEKLGLSSSRVSRYLKRRLERIERDAPRSAEQLTEMREIMRDRLEVIYSQTCSQPKSVRSLTLRLDCLESLAELYGLNLESPKRAVASPQPSYATPAEIVQAVKAR